jgi:signal transduction histidine kinase
MIDLSAAPFVVGELIGTIISALAARTVWPHRRQPGAMALAMTLWLCVWWSFWHALSLAAATLPLKLGLAAVWTVGSASVDSTILLFALGYWRQARLPRLATVLICLPAAAAILAYWTNPWLHLYWPRTFLVPGPPFTRLGLQLGPAALAFGLWAALAVAATLGLLLAVAREHRGLYRRQVLFMLGGILLPAISFALFISGHGPVAAYDVTTLCLPVGVSLIAWALYGQRLFDLVPVAHGQVMDSMGDAVLVVDAQGRVVYVNEAARAFAGRADVVGSSLSVSLPELWRLVESGRGRGELEHRLEGQVRTFDVLVCPLRGRGGAGQGRALILRDDTDRRLVGELQRSRDEVIAELRQANAQLLQLDQMKSNLISNVSHELRAPLSSIRAFAELLMDESLDGVTREEFTRIVHDEAERLTRLVNSVLDMSRIESGSAGWRAQPVDVRDVLRGCVAMFRPAAQDKGLELALQAEPGLPQAQFDPDGLHQVVTNLVSNAIKFTARGQVTVSARADGQSIVVAVEDTGSGIPADEQQSVFQRFYQGGDVLAAKPPGSGLGLAIVKEILRQHGTDITLESSPGQGSRFSFTLPLAARPESLIPG